MTTPQEALQKALEADAEFLAKVGGCTDGGCIVSKPKGMHTNGGCRCSRNDFKMQRLGYAHQKLVDAVTAALAQQAAQESQPDKPDHFRDVTIKAREDNAAFRECRHCGWECRPNTGASKRWYPLEQAPAGEVPWHEQDDPKCRDGGEACTDCLCRGQCIVALSTPPAVPPGHVIVPVKPTREMISAMARSKARDDEGEFPAMLDLLDFSGENKTHTVLKAAYTAALSAAPAAPETTLSEQIEALSREFAKHPQLRPLIGREALVLRCVQAAAPQGEQP